MTGVVRILGIDPGSQITGFGIVDASLHHSVLVKSGCIRVADQPFADRLRDIFKAVQDLTDTYAPDEIAIERVFMARNADSALKLGHARAAAMCATFSRAVPIYEYAPRDIKKSVVGTGTATKLQVQHMVKVLLAVTGQVQSDAADALAAALCHANRRQLDKRMALREAEYAK